MRRCFVFLICLGLMIGLVSCEKPWGEPEDTDAADKTEKVETPVPEISFLDQSMKTAWREDLTAVLSKVDIWDPENGMPGSSAVGLMDLSFDGIPEVLVAWPGGSMGNVFFEIYDLSNQNRLGTYNAGGYQKSAPQVHFFVAEIGGGYVTLTEGSMRTFENGWMDFIVQIPHPIEFQDGYLKTERLFAIAEQVNSMGEGPYFVGEAHAENSEYAEAYQKYLRDYSAVEGSELQMIRWSSLDQSKKDTLVEQMAEALINSDQKFVKIGS